MSWQGIRVDSRGGKREVDRAALGGPFVTLGLPRARPRRPVVETFPAPQGSPRPSPQRPGAVRLVSPPWGGPRPPGDAWGEGPFCRAGGAWWALGSYTHPMVGGRVKNRRSGRVKERGSKGRARWGGRARGGESAPRPRAPVTAKNPPGRRCRSLAWTFVKTPPPGWFPGRSLRVSRGILFSPVGGPPMGGLENFWVVLSRLSSFGLGGGPVIGVGLSFKNCFLFYSPKQQILNPFNNNKFKIMCVGYFNFALSFLGCGGLMVMRESARVWQNKGGPNHGGNPLPLLPPPHPAPPFSPKSWPPRPN